MPSLRVMVGELAAITEPLDGEGAMETDPETDPEPDPDPEPEPAEESEELADEAVEEAFEEVEVVGDSRVTPVLMGRFMEEHLGVRYAVHLGIIEEIAAIAGVGHRVDSASSACDHTSTATSACTSCSSTSRDLLIGSNGQREWRSIGQGKVSGGATATTGDIALNQTTQTAQLALGGHHLDIGGYNHCAIVVGDNLPPNRLHTARSTNGGQLGNGTTGSTGGHHYTRTRLALGLSLLRGDRNASTSLEQLDQGGILGIRVGGRGNATDGASGLQGSQSTHRRGGGYIVGGYGDRVGASAQIQGLRLLLTPAEDLDALGQANLLDTESTAALDGRGRWENRCGGARTGGHRLGVTAGARLRIEEALQVAD